MKNFIIIILLLILFLQWVQAQELKENMLNLQICIEEGI